MQLLTSDGKLRSRVRKASPSGDMQIDKCRLARTRETKMLYSATLVCGVPAACAIGRIELRIWPLSLSSNKLGTSPVLRMLLMSSRKDSLTICVSENRKTTETPAACPPRPILKSSFLRSSFHSTLPYDFVISIWKQSYSAMDAARRESDWRPEPPTPSSSELPSGWRMTREMRATWPTASTNMTSGIFFVVVAL